MERTAVSNVRFVSILLKKSACHSVAKFPYDLFSLLGILIQGSVLPDSIPSGWRNKIRRADFFNRILAIPA
jgi:hypothetical protein